MSVNKAAIGCTINRFVSELRALEGRAKSAFVGSSSATSYTLAIEVYRVGGVRVEEGCEARQ